MYATRWTRVGIAAFGVATAATVVAMPMVALPPIAAALAVLTAAAFAVDYFGLARKLADRLAWRGSDATRARARAQTLARRFARERAACSPRTAWTARALLIALARAGRLQEAGAVVDFLALDAICARVGDDITADALRAVALTELGRGEEARALCRELTRRRCARRPEVAYAIARVAEVETRFADGLACVDRALAADGVSAVIRRDLALTRARLLARCRATDAVEYLSHLVAGGYKGDVERMAARARAHGDSGLALITWQALRQVGPYR